MSDKQKYRPSNASEFDGFFTSWCEHCEYERAHQEEDGEPCPTLGGSFVYNLDDPEYPKEWTYDEYNKPCCTAFVQSGDRPPIKDDRTLDMFNANNN